MMHTDDEAPHKKKSDKSHTSTENLTVSVEKHDTAKKSDKGDSDDPKPRIVLTFRSEKTSAKSTNMKIVSTEEKHEESTPRRSSRTKSKWEWICDSDPAASPKKDRTITHSENDESESSSYTPPRLRRRGSKDDVIANAIARKERSYEAALGPLQRLSRRIKPTAKILANEELRIGLECQNNARGIQSDKSPEEGVRTRRSAKPVNVEETKAKDKEASEVEVVEIDDDSQSQTSQVMKLKHLCELGLKAINPEGEVEEGGRENREEVEALDDEEIDDDSEVISKLLEADEDTGVDDSDEDFYCSEAGSQSERPRRSTRLCSTYGDHSSPTPGDDGQKTPPRRSARLEAIGQNDVDIFNRPKSRKNYGRHRYNREDQYCGEDEDTSNPAGGDEGAEAACPEGEATVIATCLCEKPDNVFAAPSELTEPVFCQAIEVVDGVRVGCSHTARKEPGGGYGALVRAGPRAPYFLACTLHTMQMRKHMCCPACGLFCTQGIFYQCSEGHLFHLECGLPFSDPKSRPGCPHCGVYSYNSDFHFGHLSWQPVNSEHFKVKVEMKCSNKRIFLPEQREQCTPAYLSFSTLNPSQLEHEPVIPEDLLPNVDLKELLDLCKDKKCEVTTQQLCEAIIAGESIQQLIPMIASLGDVNSTWEGSTGVHWGARRGHVAALHTLALAGAGLDVPDRSGRTPLIVALHALLEKPENKSKDKFKDVSKDSTDVEMDQSKEDNDKDEIDKTLDESELTRPKDEDLMRAIRYLLAAGCDVDVAGPDGMTALHVAAQLGGGPACEALLAAGASLGARDHGGWTPLVWAAENDHAQVVRVLLCAGADATPGDLEHNQAVHWCAAAGAGSSLRLLLHHAPHVLHAPNNHGDTPLHIAARQGHYGCVVILLARGARTGLENSAGELPVQVCSGQCKNAILLNMQMKMALGGTSVRKRVLTSDVSNGRELHPIPCVNEIDDASAPDDFTYVTSHVLPQSLAIDNTIESMQGCTCSETQGDCSSGSCACGVLSVRRWYSRGRLPAAFPYHDPPMLFECNQTCGCNAKTCGNHVVSNLSAQGSVGPRVEVFRAGGARGWGLRSGPGAFIPRGTPVALYCGELLTLAQADTRTKDYYMFALDVKPDLLEQCPDKTQLCVDAAQYGSAARFINHSCSPNLAPVRVFTSTRDLRLPTVTLFATKDIQPGEELTFDYGDKFWSVKSKYMKCECGSVDCKYPVKSTEEAES